MLEHPDWIDQELAERSLHEFTRQMWRFVDPAPFRDNWHMGCIAEHLEAVTRGEISRLVINIPPRHSKSSLVAVMWPAWTWTKRRRDDGLLAGPQVKFMSASYAQTLSVRDSVKCRRLIESPIYQRRWGDRFKLTSDQNTKIRFENNKGGYRIATSVGGALTGEGGDIICFPADEIVWTEDGPLTFGDLVRQRLPLRVWSVNLRTGQRELKPITGWHKNPGSAIVRIKLNDGTSFRCTPDHRIWTQRGWVEAASLSVRDVLPATPTLYVQNGRVVNAVSRRQGPQRIARCADVMNVCFGKFRKAMAGASAAVVAATNVDSSRRPRLAPAYGADRGFGDAVSLRQHRVSLIASGNVAGLTASQLRMGDMVTAHAGAVVQLIGDVFRMSAVAQILQPTVSRIAVKMANLLTVSRRSDKGQHDGLVHFERRRGSVSTRAKLWIALAEGQFQPAAGQSHWPTTMHHCSGQTLNAPEVRNEVVRKSGDRSPALVEFVGHATRTYCLTVADHHNMIVGASQATCSNCIDDPINAIDAGSEVVRESTNTWFDESMSSRLNDPDAGAFVIIMQRLHHQDLTGHVLDKGDDKGDWSHICLPARYEHDHPHVFAGDERTRDGELLWPERFSETAISKLERDLGSYGAAGQLQQRPSPREGGMFDRNWWKIVEAAPAGGQVVRGWDLAGSTEPGSAWTAGCRMRLVDGEYFIEDIMRLRGTPKTVETTIQRTATRDGTTVQIDLPQDPGQAGKAQAQYFVRQLAGFNVRYSLESGAKEVRAEALSAQAEAGNVKLVRGPWNHTFIEEAALFPNSDYSDQIDSASRAFHRLTRRRGMRGMTAPVLLNV